MSQWPLHAAHDTQQLGAALGRACPWSASTPRLLTLQGELGAGKTTLAQGLLASVGVVGPVRSPSYTLIESYDVAAGRVVHADLYRLHGGAELETLGLRDDFLGGTLLLVEWPERAHALLPTADLHVTLSVTGHARSARLDARTPAGIGWLAALKL